MRAALTGALLALSGAAAAQMLDGHGGPVMDIAVARDGTVATASFDNSVGLWTDGVPRWLEGHEAAVNVVAMLPDGRVASGADDFDVIVWESASGEVAQRLEGHRGKVAGLAAHGGLIASASWDGTVRLWSEDGVQVLGDHDGPVNAVAFGPGGALYSASADGTVRLRDLSGDGAARTIVEHGFGINEIVLGPDAGWLAWGAVDGTAKVTDLASGAEIADLSAGRRPILALALSADAEALAVGDGEGHILIAGTSDWTVRHDFRATLRGPVWALGFAPDGGRLYAAGLDSGVQAWPMDALGEGTVIASGDESFLADPATLPNGERQFKRKCSICHTLGPDGERRAGPSLHDLFGRRAGTVPGYSYSEALEGSDLVWTEDSIDALFDIGPDHYVPGTKMPMQRIAGAGDRADLIDYLRRATAATE